MPNGTVDYHARPPPSMLIILIIFLLLIVFFTLGVFYWKPLHFIVSAVFLFLFIAFINGNQMFGKPVTLFNGTEDSAFPDIVIMFILVAGITEIFAGMGNALTGMWRISLTCFICGGIAPRSFQSILVNLYKFWAIIIFIISIVFIILSPTFLNLPENKLTNYIIIVVLLFIVSVTANIISGYVSSISDDRATGISAGLRIFSYSTILGTIIVSAVFFIILI
jgi:hypothetical protein